MFDGGGPPPPWNANNTMNIPSVDVGALKLLEEGSVPWHAVDWFDFDWFDFVWCEMFM